MLNKLKTNVRQPFNPSSGHSRPILKQNSQKKLLNLSGIADKKVSKSPTISIYNLDCGHIIELIDSEEVRQDLEKYLGKELK